MSLTRQEKMEAALEAVVLFHSGSPWDDAKRARWDTLAEALLGFAAGGGHWEATTRVLCDMVRAARTP